MASTSHSETVDVCSITESPIIEQPKSVDQITIDSDFSEGEDDLTLSQKDASRKSESGKLLFTKRFVSLRPKIRIYLLVCTLT
jgi:hypothetical protein